MKKINESFECVGCEKQIDPANKTCRNHCSSCFLSLHVDGDMPGDRATDCGGRMIPTEYLIGNGSIRIHFLCIDCHKEHWNKVSDDDEVGDLDRWIAHWKQKYEMHIEKSRAN